MGKIWMTGGGGVNLDVVTADKSDVLSGKIIVDKDGNPSTGTMQNRGAISTLLGINGTYTIPEGYHNGSGKVTQEITTMGGQTITPGNSQQTIFTNGKYMNGDIVVNAVTKFFRYNFAGSTSGSVYLEGRLFYKLNITGFLFYPIAARVSISNGYTIFMDGAASISDWRSGNEWYGVLSGSLTGQVQQYGNLVMLVPFAGTWSGSLIGSL